MSRLPQPVRVSDYSSGDKYFPNELVRKNGELYINQSGSLVRTNKPITVDASLVVNNWTGSGPYTLNVTVSGCTANHFPILSLDNSSSDTAEMRESFGKITKVESGNNVVVIYSTEKIAIPVKITCV